MKELIAVSSKKQKISSVFLLPFLHCEFGVYILNIFVRGKMGDTMRCIITIMLASVFSTFGITSKSQVNTQQYNTLKFALREQKTWFQSVSATITETIKASEEKKLRPNQSAWGSVSGQRQYQWQWAGKRTAITVHEQQSQDGDLYSTNISDKNENKSYFLSLDKKRSVGGQGTIDIARGTIPTPASFAFQIEDEWLNDILDRFKWEELKQVNDPQLGLVLVLRGSSPMGRVELDFSVTQKYMLVRQRKTSNGHLTEYKINSSANSKNFFFPLNMVETTYAGETSNGSITRMLTLEVSNLVFNKVPDEVFKPKWRNGMIVKDSASQIVYEVKEGQLVVSKYTVVETYNETLVGWAFLISFMLVGLLIIQQFVKRKRLKQF